MKVHGKQFCNIQSHVNAHLQEINLHQTYAVSTIKSVVYRQLKVWCTKCTIPLWLF